MRTLIVYYSRSGMTRMAAQDINEKISGDIEEIIDNKDRSGVIGYLLSGCGAIFKKKADLKDMRSNPAEYDLVIVGTPVWAGTVSAPVRTYLEKYKGSFKKIVFFCTMGGNKGSKTLAVMESLSDKKPEYTLALTDREIISGVSINKIESMIKSIII